MKLVNLVAPLLVVPFVHLAGCAEGGTGGTGGFVPAGPAASAMLQGQANKGPYADGARVRARALSPSGTPGGATVTAETSDLGRFSFELTTDRTWLVEVTGTYYSEVDGTYTADEFTVAAIVRVDGVDDGIAVDPNLLTTLIAPRVQQLMADGLEADVAISTAEGELVGTLAPLVAVPATTPVFTELHLLDRTGATPDPVGNGYLLAVTAILEAHAASTGGLAALVEAWATEFAGNGVIDLATDLDALRAAAASLDPDVIANGLIALDASIVAAFADLEAPAGVDCSTMQGEVTCTDTTSAPSTPVSTPRALSTYVADMNLFLDSDADGVVNRDDDDDDGDGVADVDDPRPYASD